MERTTNPDGSFTTYMTMKEFKDLGEYSCSLPTGTTIGKRWRRNGLAYDRSSDALAVTVETKLSGEAIHDFWYMGEYYDIGSKEEVGIQWSRIRIV